MPAKLFGDVKPGDRLFRVKRGHRQNDPLQTDWVVVTKVGRKWAEFDKESEPGRSWAGGRFDLETGRIDGRGFSSSAGVHRDEAAWRADQAARARWRQLVDALRYASIPPGVTAADILHAAVLLKLDLTK